MIIDSHAHYEDDAFDNDREELLKSLNKNGIEKVINVGSSMKTTLESIKLSEKYDFIYAAVGVHPEHTEKMKEEDIQIIKKLCHEEKVVAIGEIGLDYYYEEPDKEIQKIWFERQLKLALEVDKPVIIHSRDACKDTLDLLKKYEGLKGVIHCYSYSKESVREFLNLGYYIGIGGVLTFKNAVKLKEAAAVIPMDKLLLETDCPYLSPVPNRGKRNSSLNIPYVVKELSSIKGISEEEIVNITHDNTVRLFKL